MRLFAREGNGRTNRLLLSAMAANAGHTLAFDVITRERMIAVNVAARLRGDPSGVRRMFDEIIDPRQVAAMRKAIDFLGDSTVPWNDLYISTTRAGQDYEGILVGRAGADFMLRVRHGDDTHLVVGDASDLAADVDSGSSVRFRALHFGPVGAGTPAGRIREIFASRRERDCGPRRAAPPPNDGKNGATSRRRRHRTPHRRTRLTPKMRRTHRLGRGRSQLPRLIAVARVPSGESGCTLPGSRRGSTSCYRAGCLTREPHACPR